MQTEEKLFLPRRPVTAELAWRRHRQLPSSQVAGCASHNPLSPGLEKSSVLGRSTKQSLDLTGRSLRKRVGLGF